MWGIYGNKLKIYSKILSLHAPMIYAQLNIIKAPIIYAEYGSTGFIFLSNNSYHYIITYPHKILNSTLNRIP